MHAASTSPATSAASGVALAADVVAVQPDADVEAPHVDVTARFEPRRPQVREREQRRLRRVDRAGRRRPCPRRSATPAIRLVGAHDDDRRQVAVGVAHRQRPAP